ncbi:MAG: hypothetical protein B9S33_18060, partial [Pedosphaera sp. Tous-C6FEB]
MVETGASFRGELKCGKEFLPRAVAGKEFPFARLCATLRRHSPMDIAFKCPLCEQDFKVEAALAGTEFRCPTCLKISLVPEPADAPTPTAPAAPAPLLEP